MTYEETRQKFNRLYRTAEGLAQVFLSGSGCLILPVGVVVSLIVQSFWPLLAVIGLSGASLAAAWWPGLRRGLSRSLVRQFFPWRRYPLDPQTVDRCVSLGPLPEPIELHLDQALRAYANIREMAQDPVWQRSGLSVHGHLATAQANLFGLLEAARVLKKVAVVIQRQGAEMENPERRARIQAQYDRKCQDLARMATSFKEAQESLAEAFIAAVDERAQARELSDRMADFVRSMETLAEGLQEAEMVLEPDLEEALAPAPRLTGETEAESVVERI